MTEQKNALPAAGLDQCAKNVPQPPAMDARDRVCLVLCLCACVLMADTMLSLPGLGVTAATAAWYAVVLGYLGRKSLQTGESRFLLAVNLLLALTFAVSSNWSFRIWNLMALTALVPIHLAVLSGAARRPWWQASMLWERAGLLFGGLFGNLRAVGAAAGGCRGRGRRVYLAVMGLAVSAAAVMLLLPVLLSADALFSSLAASAVRLLKIKLSAGMVRLLIGLVFTPFAFGLVERLRRPRLPQERQGVVLAVDTLPLAIFLAALCLLYLLFLGVQAAGLAGGADYLRSRGISYADWARSGFFQMTGVTVVNLAAVLAVCRLSGGRRRLLRTLSTLLIAESLALLGSAVWRMSLYVGAYGLSFKRCMTYWGMAMMALFFAFALRTVLRPEKSFCRPAFLAAVVGWVIISCVPIDLLVARDNVGRCLDGGRRPDVAYLAYSLSYDALGPLSELDGDMQLYPGTTVSGALRERRQAARKECDHWESWNLSAYLAGRAGE